MPLRFMASLFSAGNQEVVAEVYRKLIGVRVYMRSKTVKDVSEAEGLEALTQGGITPEVAGAMYRLTALPTYDERFVIPPMAREQVIEQRTGTDVHKGAAGFGFRQSPARRW